MLLASGRGGLETGEWENCSLVKLGGIERCVHCSTPSAADG